MGLAGLLLLSHGSGHSDRFVHSGLHEEDDYSGSLRFAGARTPVELVFLDLCSQCGLVSWELVKPVDQENVASRLRSSRDPYQHR